MLDWREITGVLGYLVLPINVAGYMNVVHKATRLPHAPLFFLSHHHLPILSYYHLDTFLTHDFTFRL